MMMCVLQAKVIHNETEQQSVSNKIQNLTQTSSNAMNSEDVKHTAEIIEKLIEFDEGAANELDQNVRIPSSSLDLTNLFIS